MGQLIIDLPWRLLVADLGPKVPTYRARVRSEKSINGIWQRAPVAVREAFRRIDMGPVEFYARVADAYWEDYYKGTLEENYVLRHGRASVPPPR